MSDEYPLFKAAVVQAAPVLLDREATIEKACRLIGEAGEAGASLVVFPETWVPAYPFWAGRIPASISSKPGKKLFARLAKNSVEVPSPSTKTLCDAANRANLHVVIGLNERDAEYGRTTLYNTTLFIDANGAILGKHRKLVPTFYERTIWGRGDGSHLDVYDTSLGVVGNLICWEHWMPLARYALYTQGEQIHTAVWPGAWGTASSPEKDKVQLATRHYALEGRLFVLSSCAFLSKEMLPDDLGLGQEVIDSWPETLLNGGSAIIGPDGDFLAGPVYGEETILYADLDLEKILEERQALDVTGHYSRPDVLRLLRNEDPMDPAESFYTEPRQSEETAFIED